MSVGFIGFPNVGKSTLVNALLDAWAPLDTVRVAASASPGKTKHLQSVLVQQEGRKVCLIDCPGLVLPSVVSSRAEMVCGGVLSIHTLRDVLAPVQLVCDTVRRAVIQDIYGLTLPRYSRRALACREPRSPLSALDHMREARIKMLRSAVMQAETSYEGRTGAGGALTTAHGGYKGVDDGLVTARHGLSHMDEGPYRAEQLLDAFCIQRGLVQQNSGLPDYNRAARLILADYLSGKLPHWALPP